ncbi:trypsin-like serine peptidase [Cupriavidus basilensis]|uniref:trypsin-like serine peptidase n=1 Tax=Cupriavidus basilensis TaxID=68895 RepID=UPI0023E8579D|nr:serine protease [Cupriavidus basilensis]MDF3886681.1 serine protease [Cupriavidus basilensis]
MSEGDNAWRNGASAPRFQRLVGCGRHASQEEGATGAQESMVTRNGLPDDLDVKAIARRLIVSERAIGGDEATGIATRLVQGANIAVAELDAGKPSWQLTDEQMIGMEAVLHVRGRPALRVLDDELESLSQYPGAEIWKVAVDRHRQDIAAVCAATGAMHVRDSFLPDSPWVQGTAWMLAPDLAITNRHVLFPPHGGVALARRLPGSTAASMKRDYDVILDFSFDNGPPRPSTYKIVDVPFVSAEHDPVDAALLRIELSAGNPIKPLAVSAESVFELERLFVVGHPGRTPVVPDDVRAVFGSPDERKRVSFGMAFAPSTEDPPELVHDASSFGGFSGGPVLGFLSTAVRALHYWGDAKLGNRAISSTALRRHAVLGELLKRGGVI